MTNERSLTPREALEALVANTERVEYGFARFGQQDRDLITRVVVGGGFELEAGVFKKAARLVALRINRPFKVRTDHGIVIGKAGDWLATNHPDDDPGSDVWVVSAERMLETYERVDGIGRLDPASVTQE